ncbi:hypothetical protein [Pontibacter pamirensis]|uniref:hypothetical protein n=1 Tax=Pontibacter pamirensis TaxID=2562824 RepID=UPI00138A04FC|nr:hypothetical protein [Pontibacter pamirensis]
MVLYSDAFFNLSYASAPDILYVALQDQRNLFVSEVRRIFVSIVSCSREHRFRRLLLDFGGNRVEMTEREYRAMMAQLAVGLLPAPVEKAALAMATDTIPEGRVETIYREMQAAVLLPLELRAFPRKTQALRWLMA